MAILLCAAVSQFPGATTALLAFLLLFNQAVWNGVWHAAATLRYRAYSPGVVTGLLIYPPLYFHLSGLALREPLLTRTGFVAALMLGGALHAWVVARQVYAARAF